MQTAICLIPVLSCSTTSRQLDCDSISKEGVRTVRVKPFAMNVNGKWLRLSLEKSVGSDSEDGWYLVADYHLPFLTGDKMCFHLNDESTVTLIVTSIGKTTRNKENVLTSQGEIPLQPGMFRATFPISEQVLQQLCERITKEITVHSVNSGWGVKINETFIMDFPFYMESARDIINDRLRLQEKNVDWTKMVI